MSCNATIERWAASEELAVFLEIRRSVLAENIRPREEIESHSKVCCLMPRFRPYIEMAYSRTKQWLVCVQSNKLYPTDEEAKAASDAGIRHPADIDPHTVLEPIDAAMCLHIFGHYYELNGSDPLYEQRGKKHEQAGRLADAITFYVESHLADPKRHGFADHLLRMTVKEYNTPDAPTRMTLLGPLHEDPRNILPPDGKAIVFAARGDLFESIGDFPTARHCYASAAYCGSVLRRIPCDDTSSRRETARSKEAVEAATNAGTKG